MIMSTLTLPRGAETTGRAAPRAPSVFVWPFPTVFEAVTAWRNRQAEPYVKTQLARLDDATLKALGYDAESIALIRKASNGAPRIWY